MRIQIYKKLLLIVSCLLLAVGSAAAAYEFDLSTVSLGARPMGMGKAFTAVSDDVNAIFANPAGLGAQKNWGLSSMLTKLPEGLEYKMAGGTYPTKFGTFGVGYLSAVKSSSPAAEGLSGNSTQLSLSYGLDLADVIKVNKSLGNLSLGAAYRITSSRSEGVGISASGGLDLGLLFRPNSKISSGFTLQNLGGTVNWENGVREKLPLVAKLGGAVDFSSVQFSIDYQRGGGLSLICGGMEFRPFEGVALRAGLDNQNLTAGVGANFDDFRFDYAYCQSKSSAENSAHYFSISYQPQGIRGQEKAEEEVKEKKAADDGSIVLNTTEGVYRLTSKKIREEKNILRYYE